MLNIERIEKDLGNLLIIQLYNFFFKLQEGRKKEKRETCNLIL